MENKRPVPNWVEITKLIVAAPLATDEADALLTLYDAGKLSLEALKEALRALAVRH